MEFVFGFLAGLGAGFMFVMIYEAAIEDGPRGTRADG